MCMNNAGAIRLGDALGQPTDFFLERQKYNRGELLHYAYNLKAVEELYLEISRA